jgi:hypothetical protein
VNEWQPFSKSSLPAIDRQIEWKVGDHGPLPFSAANVHKYVSLYGDNACACWRYT